jgi:hypothetical protein
MGDCCFTPTKRDFLWWYWLLLVSIVGIPMLLAVMYVSVAPATDEAGKRRRGQVAAWIFWLGTAVTTAATFAVLWLVLNRVYPGVAVREWWRNEGAWHDGSVFLAVQFCVAFIFASLTNGLVRGKSRYARILWFVVGILTYVVVFLLPDLAFRRPTVNVMQFIVAMLPAHCWGAFKALPERRAAWKTLAAFVIAVPLFFIVSCYGEDFAVWVFGLFWHYQ